MTGKKASAAATKAPRTGGYYTKKQMRRVQEADPELMKGPKAERYFREMGTLSTELDDINAKRASILEKLTARSQFLKTLSKKKAVVKSLEEEEEATKEEENSPTAADKMEVDEEKPATADTTTPVTPSPEPATTTPAPTPAPAPAPAPAPTVSVASSEAPPPAFSMPSIFGQGPAGMVQ